MSPHARGARDRSLTSMLLACAMLSLLLAACAASDGADTTPTRLDWDLSHSHSIDNVDWAKPARDALDLRPIESLRIRFPGGRELTESDGIRRVALFREDQLLTSVTVFSEPLTVDDAHRLALRWCREWKLPTTAIDAWHAQGGTRFNLGAYEPREKARPNRPSPSVEVLHSFDDDRTVVVSLGFFWES